MNLEKFESNVRDIREDSSVERIEVTTVPMTKEQAKSIGGALIDFKDVTMELTKSDNIGRQVMIFEII